MVDPNAVGLSDDSLDSDFPLETRVRRNMYAAVVAASSAIVRILSTAPSAPPADSLGPLIAMCDSRLLALERMAMKQTGMKKTVMNIVTDWYGLTFYRCRQSSVLSASHFVILLPTKPSIPKPRRAAAALYIMLQAHK